MKQFRIGENNSALTRTIGPLMARDLHSARKHGNQPKNDGASSHFIVRSVAYLEGDYITRRSIVLLDAGAAPT